MFETSYSPNSFARVVSSSSVSSGSSASLMLSHRLLRVATNQFDHRDAVDLVDLVVDAGEVAHRATLRAADAGDGDLVVLVDEGDGAVAGGEGGHLLAVLDKLDADALPDRGVGLLRLDAHLLQYDAAGLRRTLEG